MGCIAEKSGFGVIRVSLWTYVHGDDAGGAVGVALLGSSCVEEPARWRVVFGNVNQVLVRLWARVIEVGGLPLMGIPSFHCMSDRVLFCASGAPPALDGECSEACVKVLSGLCLKAIHKDCWRIKTIGPVVC